MNNHKHNHVHDHNHEHVQHHQHENDLPIYDDAKVNGFAVPFLLIFVFAFIELFGGIYTQSLALVSDAWHMFSDVFALGLAWFAAHLSAKPGTHKHANGQSHIEIAAAAFNAILMLSVIGYIVYEALQRFKHPQVVTGAYVMLIALAGLVVNLIVAKMLHGNHAHDHNKKAAYLHVMGDLLGSVAAIIAGAVIYITGWQQIDPILSIFISMLILVVTIQLMKDIWFAYKNG